MKLTSLLVCGCAIVAMTGCGSSSSKGSSTTPAATASAQDQAASQVCAARDGIQTQVQALTSLSAGTATKAGITSALDSISTHLTKIKDAQPNLAPARKQQVQTAVTAFGTQLTSILRQTVAGLSKTDAKTQASNAAKSLDSAVKASLQPIQC